MLRSSEDRVRGDSESLVPPSRLVRSARRDERELMLLFLVPGGRVKRVAQRLRVLSTRGKG